jgi:transcriptional regulator with XRE-family HTH domain
MNTRLAWKLRRIAAGYRQQDIAARLGMSSTRYSALERGEAEAKEWEIGAVEKLLPPLPQAVRATGVSEKEVRAGT